MATSGSFHFDGQSTIESPFFDGLVYTFWKRKVKIFIQLLDFNLWILTIHGPSIPMKDVSGVKNPKIFEEYDMEDMKRMTMNTKDKNVATCALGRNEYSRVSSCASAHEMWKL